MTIFPENNFDYTPRDFEAIRARLFALIQTHFVDDAGRPIWTDTQAKSFGNLLVELFSHVGDGLAFYRDEFTLELYLPTVAHRENAIRILRLITYAMEGPRPATATLRFSIPVVAVADVPIAVRTRVISAADPAVVYESLAAATLPAGDLYVDVDAEQAVSVEESVASTGLPNQRHKLAASPYLDGSLVPEDALGTWTEVENFLSSRPIDRHFRVEVDAFDQATAIYGDGTLGAIPVGTIVHRFKTTLGTAGAVEAGTLTKLSVGFSDLLGNPVSMRVVNASASAGGTNRETVEQARVRAPADLRATNRTVAREDFEINGLRADGVARTLMLTSNEVVGIQENTGKLFCVAFGVRYASGYYGPATPTPTQLAAALTEIQTTRPHTITFQPTVLAAPFFDTDIDSTVYLKQGYTEAQVRANIDAALQNFFAVALPDGTENPVIKFGYYYQNAIGTFIGELAWSDVFNVIRDATGVRKVSSGPDGLLLNGVRQSVYLQPQDFPRLGSVILRNGDTGGLF